MFHGKVKSLIQRHFKTVAAEPIFSSFIKTICILLAIFAAAQIVNDKNLYEKSLIENYYYYSINKLDECVSSAENNIKAVTDIAMKIYAESKLTYVIRTDSDMGELNEIVLRNMYTNSNICNILFYQKDIGKITDLSNGKDVDVIENIDEITENTVDYSYRIINTSQYGGSDTYIFFQPDKLYNEYFLVGIKEENIKSIMNEYCLKYDANLIVLNADGTVFFGNNDANIESNYNDAYDSFNSGYKLIKYNGRKSILINKYVSGGGLYYYTVLDYKNIRQNAPKTERLTPIYFSLLMVVTLIFAIYFIVIKKLYNPMRKMKVDLNMIRRQQKEENEMEALYDFMLAEEPDEEVRKQASGIFLDKFDENEKICVVLVEIDDLKAFEKNNSAVWQKRIIYGMSNVFEEMLENVGVCMRVGTGTGRLFELVSVKEETENLNELLKTFCSTIETIFEFSVSVFYGKPCDFFEINVEYAEIMKKREYKFLRGDAIIIGGEQPEDDKRLDKRFLKNILEDLSKSDFENSETHIKEFAEALSKLKPSTAKNELIVATSKIEETVSGKFGSETENSVSSESLLLTVTNSKNIFEAEEAVKNYLKKVEDSIEKKENNMYNVIVNKIYAIIKENYGDNAFCVSSVADMLNYSTVYLCRIFKNNTGRLLSDEILNYRLEQSALLLLQTERTVKEISSLCGFVNYSHYCTVFKKKYMLSPSEYRKRCEK